MFERNRPEIQEQGAVSVEITLDDGTVVTGRMLIAASRTLFDVLNGPSLFVEFEPFEGERRFVAKSALRAVKLLAGARPLNLAQKARDLDGFDPHTILCVKPASPWDDVRSAYLAAAKAYHPDRYANTDLPAEVTAYLAAMLRRVNTAYAALELTHKPPRNTENRKPEAIFVSGQRAAPAAPAAHPIR